tara:strand:- start:2199 stop:2966 length:768 start_codon:yes stop_codon:yes gene_type:complete
MKVAILAGGFGTRLSEYTDKIPKPMVSIGGYPILWHIMNHYYSYGFSDFYIALGYKSELIKKYFLDLNILVDDFSIDLKSGDIKVFSKNRPSWKITFVETGLQSMTGGRVRRLKPYIGEESFMLTYGDGLSNINISDLITFHHSHKKIGTITAVRPVARFGELVIENKLVKSFKEKPQVSKSWVNGGFFVFNPSIFEYIDNDETVLEAGPLEILSKESNLMAFKHDGFWQCMDTKRDRDYLEKLWRNGDALWCQK